ncbi:PREDICTED: odorant receptor 22c-like, partial [Dinoponera quadriceps]|uniref:Odorant receptor n=1 Tax=Dinoponera quadriceps TaxID=609295 RepID=A0A6P3Y982_DINQU
MLEVAQNEHYQEDVKNILQLTHNILFALGVWPNSSGKRSTCEKIGKLLRILVAYTFLFCSLMPGALYWIFEKRARARLRTTTIMLYGLMSVAKYYNLITREDQIRHCLKHFEEDWKNVDNVDARNTMLKSARIGRRLVMISAGFLYSSGIAFRTLIPLARGKTVTPQNVTIRPLPYPTYLFSFDFYSSPTYEIVYAMQCFSGLVTISIAVSLYGLVIIFTLHACGQLKVLVDLINGLVEKKERDESKVNKKLSVIVNHQTRIRSFLQLVEHTLQQMCFIELAGGTIIICILSYCILMEWESSNSIGMSSYFISLIAGVINIFMFCYTGEQLMTQAEKVAVTSCELEWYRLPDKKARGIVLVMIMSNVPLKITAGKPFVLSVKTFGE